MCLRAFPISMMQRRAVSTCGPTWTLLDVFSIWLYQSTTSQDSRMARLSIVASCAPENEHGCHYLGSKKIALVYRTGTGLLCRAEEDSAAKRQTSPDQDHRGLVIPCLPNWDFILISCLRSFHFNHSNMETRLFLHDPSKGLIDHLSVFQIDWLHIQSSCIIICKYIYIFIYVHIYIYIYI